MPNEEMIRIVIKRIERDLEMWNQDNWGHVFAEEPAWRDAPVETVDIPNEAKDEGMWDDWHRSVSPFTDGMVTSCGTTFCFAGHTVLEAGDTMLVSTHDYQARLCRTPDGQVRHIMYRAAELLGLEDEDQAGMLFSAGIEDIEDLKRVITQETGVTFE